MIKMAQPTQPHAEELLKHLATCPQCKRVKRRGAHCAEAKRLIRLTTKERHG